MTSPMLLKRKLQLRKVKLIVQDDKETQMQGSLLPLHSTTLYSLNVNCRKKLWQTLKGKKKKKDSWVSCLVHPSELSPLSILQFELFYNSVNYRKLIIMQMIAQNCKLVVSGRVQLRIALWIDCFFVFTCKFIPAFLICLICMCIDLNSPLNRLKYHTSSMID